MTTPAVRTRAVSGSSLGLPPSWTRVSDAPYAAVPGTPRFAHSAATSGSSVIGTPSGRVSHGSISGSALSVLPWYSSLTDGARNDVEYVLRIAKPLIVRNSAPAFQVRPLP